MSPPRISESVNTALAHGRVGNYRKSICATRPHVADADRGCQAARPAWSRSPERAVQSYFV
jgi:hypothetical protein